MTKLYRVQKDIRKLSDEELLKEYESIRDCIEVEGWEYEVTDGLVRYLDDLWKALEQRTKPRRQNANN